MENTYLDYVIKLRNTHKHTYGALLAHHNPEILQWINDSTPLLQDKKYNLSTKIYWILHNITEFPKCPVCNKEMHKNVDTFDRGYFRACSKDCAASSPLRKEKIENTMLERYGVKSFLETDKSKDALREWCNERNVINPFQDADVKIKAAKSRFEHFGYEYTMQSPEKRLLASKNYYAKTGYTHQFYNPNVISKIESTIKDKIDNGIDLRQKFKDNAKRRRYDSLFTNEVIPLFSFDEFVRTNINTQYTTEFNWKCLACNNEFTGFLDQNSLTRHGYPCRCLNCHPINAGRSEAEYEIANVIKQCNCYAIMHDRKQIYPLELDIFCPVQNFAIEFDGLYWHSTLAGDVSKYYHFNKTSLCNKHNITLLHIFEDEYLANSNAIYNLIKQHLNTLTQYSYKVTKIDKDTLSTFIKLNGTKISYNTNVIAYGLSVNNVIKCICTFSKSRNKNTYNLVDIIYAGEIYYDKSEMCIIDYFADINKCKTITYIYDRHLSFEKRLLNGGFIITDLRQPKTWYVSHRKRFSANLQGEICGKMWDCGYDILIKTY